MFFFVGFLLDSAKHCTAASSKSTDVPILAQPKAKHLSSIHPNNVPDHKLGAPLPTAAGVTAKVSTYHRDVPASILGVAHYIVPQVPQHVWQVGGGHLGTWRVVAHVSVPKTTQYK